MARFINISEAEEVFMWSANKASIYLSAYFKCRAGNQEAPYERIFDIEARKLNAKLYQSRLTPVNFLYIYE